MRFAKGLALLGCFVGLFSLAGCNKSMPADLGPRIPVEGKVTLAGKPLKGGNVNFYPLEKDASTLQPMGVIDEQGHYFVSSYSQKGAPAGKYRVTVDPGSDDKELDMAVDAIYSNSEKSPLIVTVQENAPPGSYDLKLEILKKKR